jgi:hypothetical protein
MEADGAFTIASRPLDADPSPPLGVTDVAMPAAPECIWRAMREHSRG